MDFTKVYRRTTYPTISPTAPSQDQAGKIVLITGGSEGIGFGIASAFVEAKAGKVIITGRTLSKLSTAQAKIRTWYPQASIETLVTDSSDDASIQNVWADLASKGTFIDTLVLNAGGLRDPETVDDEIANFTFTCNMTLRQVDLFRKQSNPSHRHKVLIHVNSAAIQMYPHNHRIDYAANKAGIASYLGHLADKIPEVEMRIIPFHPGAVYSAIVERLNPPKDLGIWDHPSLSAHTCVWLCGKDAAFLHGRFVWTNWDVDELLQRKDKIANAEPGYLKVGIEGLKNSTMEEFRKKCTENPVEGGWVPA